MIVLDEQLSNARIVGGVERIYRGSVRTITDLAPPHAVIKDELVPRLLRQHRGSTLVTINWTDFWRVLEPDERFSCICFAVSSPRALELPALVARALRHPELRHKRARCGRVFLIKQDEVFWYERLSGPVQRRPFGG
jgi:hypothetical protein